MPLLHAGFIHWSCLHIFPAAGGTDASKLGLAGVDASSMQSRAELWRQSKKARAAEWAAFNASRPDESFEAPADLAALAEAAATIGDYKLKSDAGYVLPEVGGQRLNTHGWQVCRLQIAAATSLVFFYVWPSGCECRQACLVSQSCSCMRLHAI
jgi:hypothetical protein